MKIRYTTLLLLVFYSFTSHSQQVVNHHCDFTSGQQNMWGPSFSAFSINQTVTLFDFPWNASGGTGNGGIVTIAGQSFGAAMNAGTSGRIGSEFKLSGFTTGTVEVDYPIDVTVDMPTDNTYNQGEWVDLETSYAVDPNYELETNYPSVGEATLDLYFQMAFNASMTVCAFGCTSFNIIPPVNTPTVTLNIFTANASGIWYLGPACATGPPLPASPGSVFPFALPPSDASCGTTIPWQVRYDFLPLEIPDNDYGISGTLTLPYVETDDNLVGYDLYATGDSTYVEMSLEIFKLLGAFVPPPVGPVLANLSNTFALPEPFATIYPASLSYTVMSASFNAYITNKQRFDFQPKVYGQYVFPVPVQYNVMSGATTLESGVSSIINIEVGNTINYKFPCYYETLDITPTYTVQGQFSNRTYDSVSFDFNFQAIQFGFSLPAITVIPEITVPEICIPYGYPCGFISWCSGSVCTPSFTIPAVGFSGFSFNLGPLVDETLPIGSFQYDWFNQNWDLEGFAPISHPAFYMQSRRFLASQTHIDNLCKANTNGSIDVTTINGTAPFTYNWTHGATTQDLTNLPAGNYQVTITDVNGCQTFTGATIVEPAAALLLNAQSSDQLCNGGIPSGNIDVTVNGGTAPYSYAWSSGQTSQDLTGIPTGTYTLTTTDNNGCTSNISRTISQPSVLGQTAAISAVKCFGGTSGDINLSPLGGVMPYTYSWNNGMTTEDVAGLGAGTYSVTVTDLNGCTHNANYTVNEPVASPSISLNMNPVSCYGGSNGTIDASPAGGTPGYQFQWFGANNMVMPQISEDLSNLQAGSYSVTMTDANGCSSSNSIVISEPNAPIGQNPILTHLNCFGVPTGEINPQISGGTAPYVFAWSNGATTPNITALLAGNYNLTVTDNRGCTANYSYTLTEPNAGLSLNLSPLDVDCFGNASGSISSQVNGGTAPYSYTWLSGHTTPNISGLIAGNYSLTITDNKGCVINSSINVNQPAAPLDATSIITNVNCHSGSNGIVDVTTTGGTAPYSYYWFEGANQVMTEISEDVINKPADIYTVEVTDAKGCEFTLVSTITQPAAALQLSTVMDDVNCFGGSDGALDATITGGTVPYSYSWSNGTTTQDISLVSAGSYNLTVTDMNGCTISNSFSIIEPQNPLSTTITPTAVLCNGASTGSAASEVTGGTAPYSYLWSNGTSTNEIDQVLAGVYSLLVTDSKGCTSFSGTSIIQPALPLAISATIIDASCYNYHDGSIELAINGGTQPYYFTWSDQNEVILNNPSETLNNLPASNFLIKVRDEHGCEAQQVYTVGQPAPFTSSIITSDALCFESADGTADLTVAGGTLPYSFNWNTGATSEDISLLTAGMYNVTITDNQGCIVRDSAKINQPLEIISNISIEELSCINQSDAAIFVKTGGGTQPYQFSWSSGASSENISGLVAGTYVLTITDAQACVQTYSVDVQSSEGECVDPVNTFTPNGDNYNDTWVIENLDLYPNATVKVFNKWGNLVFESTGAYQPWDGTTKGERLPSEVYFYIIDLYNDQNNQYTGSITIIR